MDDKREDVISVSNEEIKYASREEKRYKIEKVESKIDNIVDEEAIGLRVTLAITAIAMIGMYMADPSTIIGQIVQMISPLFAGAGLIKTVGSIGKLIGLDITKRDMERLEKSGYETVGKHYDGKLLGVMPVVKDLNDNIVARMENRDRTLTEIYENWKKEEETEEKAEAQGEKKI